jgi:hypothetical protein
LFCLCWWLYFFSWLSCLILSMLVIVFLVLIALSYSAYVADCICCPDCLVLFCPCWWLYFLSWLSCLVLSMLTTWVEQDKTIRTTNTISNIGRIRQRNQDKKYNHQHRQNKTRQSGQEIQSPTQAEQDKAIRTRNTIMLIVFLVLIVLSCSVYVGDCISCPVVLSCSAYVGDCISCPDCIVLFCLCWWLYFLSWLPCLVLPMLVIAFLVLIILSCDAYVGDCISCPDCLQSCYCDCLI